MTEVLLNHMGFNYPTLLCAFNMACNWAGTECFYLLAAADRPSFERRQWALVAILSVMSALNTVVGRSNISVPTTFDQVLRSAVPVLVVLIATRVFKRSVSRARKVAVTPIVFGVAMAWYGKMEISVAALTVSVVCIALSAAKVVIWSEMLTGEFKVSPVHLLSHVAPLTFVQVGAYALFLGEAAAMVAQWHELLTGYALHVVAVTGVSSFFLTIITMHATTFATPLTVSVLGNLKQILVIAFSIIRMQRPMSRLNLLGVIMVAAGTVRYTMVSASERRHRDKRDAICAGSDKEKPVEKGRASLLPTTAVPAVPTSSGKRHAKGTTEKSVGGMGGRVRAMAWGGLWGGGKRDASRRSR